MKITYILSVIGLTFLLAADDASFEQQRGSRVAWARLKFDVTGYRGGNTALGWFHHPAGDIRVVDFLRENTDINIMQEWNVVDVKNLEHMCVFPMLFLSGKGAINLADKEKSNLKEYILRGGFLFVDDCVALGQVKQDLFFDSVNKLLKEILPGIEIKQLTREHPLYNSYYKIRGWTHMQGKNNGIWGAWYEGRLVMFTNSSDLHCAWTGFHFSNHQRSEAFKWAANIYVYAMTRID